MERAIKGLVTGRYEWIGFTSVNAVKAVREKFEEFGLDARAFAGMKIAAVGEGTAAALLEWGLKPDLVPSGEQSARRAARGLAAVRRGARPDQPGLPAARRHRHRDPRGRPAGAWAGRSTTSPPTARCGPPRRPPPVREAIKGGRFDAVVFTSSSTVRNLVGIAGKPHTVDGHRLHRAGHRQDGRGARPAGRRPGARGLGARRWPRPSPTTGWAWRRRQRRPASRWSARARREHPRGAGPRSGPASRRARPGRAPAAAAPVGSACVGSSPRRGCTRPSWSCRSSSARARASRSRSGPCPASCSTRWIPALARQAVDAGIGGLMLFGVPEDKDARGSGGRPGRHPQRRHRAVADAVGDDGRDGRPVPRRVHRPRPLRRP